jgi:nucleoid-associated protein YgaU
MKKMSIVYFLLAAALLLSVTPVTAQEMNKEQWQQEMDRYTRMRNEIQGKVRDIGTRIENLRAQSTKLDADYKKCLDELYALVGSDAEKAAAYRREIEAAENKANELMRLSDADLMARSKEVDQLAATVKKLWENRLSLIPEFWDKLTALNEKVKTLQNTLAGMGKTYTVGTWARNRDCLWNIAKKKDIYNNAWLWPKIWQGNRDQIKDPDIIHPGQKLKIPSGTSLTSEEKSAANSYYRKKAGN